VRAGQGTTAEHLRALLKRDKDAEYDERMAGERAASAQEAAALRAEIDSLRAQLASGAPAPHAAAAPAADALALAPPPEAVDDDTPHDVVLWKARAPTPQSLLPPPPPVQSGHVSSIPPY
jgi:hypothetical protein